MPLYPRTSTDEAAWHEWLFRCLASTIIVQLDALEGQLQPWDPSALVVLVVCYLHRIARPLAVCLREVTDGAKTTGLLHAPTAANVQACVVDTLTGPTPEISHIIRHRRTSRAADQHKGNQADLHRL